MDAPATAAWLVLVAVLGILLLGAVLAGVAALRPRSGAAAPTGDDAAPPVDDLADFLEHPPGSRASLPGRDGWVTLAVPPEAPAPVPGTARRRHPLALAAGCLAALALVGTAAAVVAGTREGDPGHAWADETSAGRPGAPAPAQPVGHGAVVAELAAGGLVLEPRAVGITAVYPELDLRVDDGAARLELRLPAYNCLTGEPPADPVVAGCATALVEHATLTGADLRVERDGDRLVLRGRAATEIRPAGSAPEPTGRVYDLELTVAPARGRVADGVRPAVGELRLGAGAAPLVPGRSTLRGGS